MIFKTTAEIKETVAINTSSRFENLSPDLQRAEDSILKKYLGSDQYDALLTDYLAHQDNIDEMDANLKALLLKARPIVAGIGLFKYAAIHGIQISDAGYQMISTDTHKQAFQWMKNEARGYLVQIGYTSLDAMLAFLEENKSTYTLWANDLTAYSNNKKFIVNDTLTFDSIVKIGESTLTYLAMLPIMKKVEDFVIKGALGASVFSDLKSRVANPDTDQIYLSIMPDLQAACVLFTVSRALYELPIQIYDSGILINYSRLFVQSDNVSSFVGADAKERQELASTYRADAEIYLKAVIDYLNENADSFPLWKASSKYVAPGTGSGEIRTKNDKTFGFY